MPTPAISVIMPVYNAERFLGEAVESILRQTFTDFELIAVDDGSTDGSLALLRRYAASDPRMRLISRPNTGIIGALRDGIAAATAPFLARMDADDLCEPRRFELQMNRLAEDPSLVAVGSNAVAVDPDGNRLGEAPVPLSHDAIEARHLAGYSSIYHPAVLIRAEAFRHAGGYRDGTFPCEDFDLWLRLGEIGRLENLPEPLFIWRRTDTGIVASNVERMRSTIMRILADAWHRRGLPGVPAEPILHVVGPDDLYRQWAWWALDNGDVRLARKYAIRAFRKSPLKKQSLRLLYAAARGR